MSTARSSVRDCRRPRVLAVRGGLVTAALLLLNGIASAAMAPVNLRCEYAENPLGIDVLRPRLGWVLESDRRGERQTAYQILAAGSLEKLNAGQADLWDSGKVGSDESAHVEYAGPPLRSGQRVWWKVRVWDRDGQPSPYSAPAWWEMGLLGSDDWQARWITVDEKQETAGSLPWGEWIWNDKVRGENRTAWFRRTFTIEAGRTVASAAIRVNADNSFTLYVNGEWVGDNKHWNMSRIYYVGHLLRPGKNVIAVSVLNSSDPAGLRVTAQVRLADGKNIDLLSGPDWLTADREQANWTAPDYDDTAWDQAVVADVMSAERWQKDPLVSGPRHSLYMRKPFAVRSGVVRARVYVTGLGLYELHLNGRKVGGDVFTPDWTEYPKRVQYQTYDVTALLNEGDSAAGVVLGNGWWSGDLGWTQRPPFSQGNLRFLMQLVVDYADGTREVVGTDNTWRACPSPITQNTFWKGETYDARMEQENWDRPGFDDALWSPVIEADPLKGVLCAQLCETIQVTEELKARQISRPFRDQDLYIVDFGQNATGWVRLKVKGPRGTRIRLRFAELLNADGTLYRDNLRHAEATDYYICKGDDEEIWEPRFTYHGFRYCEITGYPGEPTLDALTFRVVHTAAKPAGEFACSNWLLNRIWRNTVWGQRSNLHSVLTDCPQRDERMGWTGDFVAFAPTACWNMDMARFLTKYMRDVRDCQAADGGVPEIVPNIFGGRAGAPGWSDIGMVLPWLQYQFYGDRRAIEESYDCMARWVGWMEKNSKNDLYERGGYGDWVALEKTPEKLFGPAWSYFGASRLALMAEAIGKKDQAERYRQLAGRIRIAFNNAYLDKEKNTYLNGSQTANIMPLAFGLVPEERRAAVLDNLVQNILERDVHLATGFQGTAWVMSVLNECGRNDLAYRLAAQDTFPSWGYMTTHGATTIWELWDADKKGPDMNSRNHVALGAIGRWFFEGLAGIDIDPASPGFRNVLIRPSPVGDLRYAGAAFASVRGRIESRWEHCGGELHLRVSIPANTTATVYLPCADRKTVTEGGSAIEQAEGVTFLSMEDGRAVYAIGSGRYEFKTTLPDNLPRRN